MIQLVCIGLVVLWLCCLPFAIADNNRHKRDRADWEARFGKQFTRDEKRKLYTNWRRVKSVDEL